MSSSSIAQESLVTFYTESLLDILIRMLKFDVVRLD